MKVLAQASITGLFCVLLSVGVEAVFGFDASKFLGILALFLVLIHMFAEHGDKFGGG